MRLDNIPVSKVIKDSRFRADYGSLIDIKVSIEENGLISPIAVEEGQNGEFKLLAGGRRLRAILDLGWKTVPARIYTKDEEVDEVKALSIELEENTKRKDLTPQEEAANVLAIHEAMTAKYGERHPSSTDPNDPAWSAKKTAEKLGKDVANVSRTLNVARAQKLMPEIFAEAKSMDDMNKILSRTKKRINAADAAERIRQTAAKTPEEIKKKKLVDSFIVGDIFKAMKDMKSNSFDLIEFDPPYAVDIKKRKKMKTGSLSRTEQAERYNEVEEGAYPEFLQASFKEFYRLLKNDRWLICWFGQYPWYELVRKWLEQAGFEVRPITAIWFKDTVGQVMNPKIDMANGYETFFYARKGQAFLNKEGRSNVYTYRPVPPQKKVYEGLPERPINMMNDILYTFVPEGNKILVPCCGSGNTMLAAANNICDPIGIDLSQDNKDAFTVRVTEEKYGEYTSYE